MSALRRRRERETLEGSDEALREQLGRIRDEQRALRREHGSGPFRDVALARIDETETQVRRRYDEVMTQVAVGGNPQPLGGPAGTVNGLLREAATLDGMLHGGFFDRLRARVETAPGFCELSSAEMAALLEPLEEKARQVGDELARRHREREELRARLRQLEVVEA